MVPRVAKVKAGTVAEGAVLARWSTKLRSPRSPRRRRPPEGAEVPVGGMRLTDDDSMRVTSMPDGCHWGNR